MFKVKLNREKWLLHGTEQSKEFLKLILPRRIDAILADAHKRYEATGDDGSTSEHGDYIEELTF